LAEAVKRFLNATNPIKVIGTRHGEKLYETLLTREERAKAEDLGGYFRVPADTRDLNYDLYFSQGDASVGSWDDYNSHNTHRLGLKEMIALLGRLTEMQEALARRIPPPKAGKRRR
jgi:UDP-N-acetylglucosamine 4,6-dehydratase/5-epimerase